MFFFESLRLPLAKGSSTFLTKPLFPQEREDVAGDAIALPEFWSASGACARKGLAGVLTQQSCECLSPNGRLYGYTLDIYRQ